MKYLEVLFFIERTLPSRERFIRDIFRTNTLYHVLSTYKPHIWLVVLFYILNYSVFVTYRLNLFLILKYQGTKKTRNVTYIQGTNITQWNNI